MTPGRTQAAWKFRVKIRHIHIRHSGRLTDGGEQGGQLIGWCVTPPLTAAAALPSPRDRCAAPPQGDRGRDDASQGGDDARGGHGRRCIRASALRQFCAPRSLPGEARVLTHGAPLSATNGCCATAGACRTPLAASSRMRSECCAPLSPLYCVTRCTPPPTSVPDGAAAAAF